MATKSLNQLVHKFLAKNIELSQHYLDKSPEAERWSNIRYHVSRQGVIHFANAFVHKANSDIILVKICLVSPNTIQPFVYGLQMGSKMNDGVGKMSSKPQILVQDRLTSSTSIIECLNIPDHFDIFNCQVIGPYLTITYLKKENDT